MSGKDDPLEQSASDQVREQMGKHTLWLNAENFEEMVKASYEGYADRDRMGVLVEQWRMYCAAALAVIEWRMGGRVRP